MRKATKFCLILCLALLAAACSSSANNDGPSSSATSGPSGSLSGTLGRASAAVKAAEAPPTDLGVTGELKSKPAPGGTIAWIECDSPTCVTITIGVKQAAAALGWHLDIIPFQLASAQTLISALDQAYTDDPTFVIENGVPPVAFQSVVPEFAAKHIPIIVGYVGPTTIDSTIIANIGGPSISHLWGKLLAEWVVADSNANAHVLLATIPEIPILTTLGPAFKKELLALCSKCTYTEQDSSAADLPAGNIPGQVVSDIQRNPAINYVIFTVGDLATGVRAALNAAGLNHVKIAGATPEVSDLQNLLDGSESAWTTLPLVWSGWAEIDCGLRHVEGMPVPADCAAIPTQLLTSSNIKTINVSQPYVGVANFQDKFKQLWRLG